MTPEQSSSGQTSTERQSTIWELAIIGTENSHVDHIIDHYNRTQGGSPARVVALVGGDPERAELLGHEDGPGQVYPSVDDLPAAIDALIITNRDGGLHRASAETFLRRGRPVWVDKPLACSVDDAAAILATARDAGQPVTSSSALRWIPAVAALRTQLDSLPGDLQSLILTGPADPSSPYGGIYFYGIHLADVAVSLVDGELGPVAVTVTGAQVTVRLTLGDVPVTLQLVRPDPDHGQVPFHVLAVGRTRLDAVELVLGHDYVAPGADAFLTILQTGTPPISDEQLLRPIQILDEVARQLSAG